MFETDALMMKKIPLAGCALIITIVCCGQIPLGFKAGINTNELILRENEGNYSKEATAGISFHFSVFAKLKLSNKFNFIPEVQFIQKQTETPVTTIKIGYIELPLVISCQPITWLSLDGGLSMGLRWEIIHDQIFLNRQILAQLQD